MSQSSLTLDSRTNIGRRQENEDSFLVLHSDALRGEFDALLIVADGMGGRASGARASRLAVETVRDSFVAALDSPLTDPAATLAACLRKANAAVYKEANTNPQLQGMGTTCVVAAISDGKVFYAHLGDSRAYLLRDGKLRRLTDDHSFVAEKVKTGEITEEQARRSRFRNIITRAIGLELDTVPETGSTDLQAGDVLLLCTDGLTGPVSDSEIADIICTSSDVSEACDRLIETALKNGGTDNITVAVAACGQRERRASVRAHQPARSRAWILGGLIGLILGLAVDLSPVHDMVKEWVSPPPKAVKSKLPRLASLKYEDPVSLFYVPVQSKSLVLDGEKYLYVVDLQGQLVRLDTTGQLIYTFPPKDVLKPQGQERFVGIATDREGNLYISDRAGKRIVKYARNGLALGSVAEGKLVAPEAIAVDAKGCIYVIDGGRLKAIRPKLAGKSDGSR